MTENEAEVLAFVRKYREEKGFSPSQDEIAEAVGRARGTVARALTRLAAYGYLTRKPGWNRSIEIIKAA
jgi:SOS-response transcriptional repressor LexA